MTKKEFINLLEDKLPDGELDAIFCLVSKFKSESKAHFQGYIAGDGLDIIETILQGMKKDPTVNRLIKDSAVLDLIKS